MKPDWEFSWLRLDGRSAKHSSSQRFRFQLYPSLLPPSVAARQLFQQTTRPKKTPFSLVPPSVSPRNTMKLTFLFFAAATCFANAAAFTYADFSDVSGLTINGDAAQVGSVLRVAPNASSKAGTAYRTAAVPFTTSTAFSTSFEFHVTTDTGNPTDGFTFLLQNAGVNAVGGAGQGSGYAGISPSVAVLFRGRDPSFIGVVTDGVDPLPLLPLGAKAHTEGDFYNKDQFVWIDYDPVTTALDVYLSDTATKPVLADMSTTIDVAGTVGSQAFVGFSAGTGGASGDNDILKWTFSSNEVPEPGTISLLLVGALGVMSRRRRSAPLPFEGNLGT